MSGCSRSRAAADDILLYAFEQALEPDVPRYKEYHASLVEHAKQVCRSRPRCSDCVLKRAVPCRQALLAEA